MIATSFAHRDGLLAGLLLLGLLLWFVEWEDIDTADTAEEEEESVAPPLALFIVMGLLIAWMGLNDVFHLGLVLSLFLVMGVVYGFLTLIVLYLALRIDDKTALYAMVKDTWVKAWQAITAYFRHFK